MTPYNPSDGKQQFLNRSYILHSRHYKDNSLILNVITYEQGRVDVLAKGVKSSKKGLAAILQPFHPILLSYQSKYQLAVMTGVEPSTSTFPQLQGKALYCGYYLNELLLRLLPIHEPNEAVFLLYEHCLNALTENERFEIILRSFEVQLLNFLGYQLNLEYDIFSELPIEAEKNYYYEPQLGPFDVNAKIPEDYLNANHLKYYPKMSGRTLLALNKLDFSDENMVKECKFLLRCVLQQHLGAKPLKSRTLFKQLYTQNDGKKDGKQKQID